MFYVGVYIRTRLSCDDSRVESCCWWTSPLKLKAFLCDHSTVMDDSKSCFVCEWLQVTRVQLSMRSVNLYWNLCWLLCWRCRWYLSPILCSHHISTTPLSFVNFAIISLPLLPSNWEHMMYLWKGKNSRPCEYLRVVRCAGNKSTLPRICA